MLFLCGVLLIVGGALAGTYRDSNTYMDQVINSALKDEINYIQLEPADSQNFHTEFKDKIGFITSKVKTDYNHGKVYGLSNVQRWEDCSAPYFAYGNITLECPLTIKDLRVEYDGNAKYGQLPTVSIQAEANIPETKLRVVVTTATTRNIPKLRSLRVERFSDIQVEYSGLGTPLNNLLDGLTDSFRPKVESNLRKIFETRFSDAVSRSVVKYNMPRPGKTIKH